MAPKQAPTLELVEDLIEVQAIAQEWCKGDDWENARHPAELASWDRAERQMVSKMAQIAQKWCKKVDIEKERPLQISA